MADIWDSYYESGRDYKSLATGDLAELLSDIDIKSDAKVLDVGCGTGQLARDLAHRGFQVTGVDSSRAAIRLAQESTVMSSESLEFITFNVERGLSDLSEFDMVFCKYIIAFIDDKTRFLQDMAGVLKSGGILVIITPDADLLPDKKAHIAVQHSEMMAALQDIFNSVQSRKLRGDRVYLVKVNA